MAHALVGLPLLRTRQMQKCLHFIHQMISLSSGCTNGMQGRYRFFSNHSRTSRAQHELKAPRHMEIAMNTSLNHGSARIYQFPAGGRAALGGRRQEEAKTAIRAAIDPGLSRVSAAACGDGWYHEAAIQESKPVREG
jgi:hypothetical protein